MAVKKFPTLAIILLLTGIIWLLNDLQILVLDIPWIPIVLIIVALGMMINRYSKN